MDCDRSPEKKKKKLHASANPLKREGDSVRSSKRTRVECEIEDIQAKKRKNFVTACEQVSYEAYFNHETRLQLIYLPACADKSVCKHQNYKKGADIREMASHAEELVKIEMKSNLWSEALEVCHLCITPEQYLSANVLKDVVEIMLNAQEDDDADYTIADLIDRCQQILSLNFSTHPPCLTKTLRKCYNDFIMSPMNRKEETFTNRAKFGYDSGIVKYCMNRLEYEISSESKDEALVDKYDNTPEDMRQSVKGLHWQKKRFEIYEVLERPERIERLMAILESIIELLQFDLVIWHSRYTNNQGCHIMRSHKPLMAYILWSEVLYTGTVNSNCRQILKLFIRMIHLQYPENHINIMITWVNVIIQTFYICETNSNSDYPNTGKYCTSFAKEFYKTVSDMPHDTILRVLERIQPSFMQHIICTLHIKTLLSSKDDDIIKILIDFLKKSQWKKFPESNSEIRITKISKIKRRKVNNIMKYLLKKCDELEIDCSQNFSENIYRKFDATTIEEDSDIDQNYVVHILYLAIEAYLDAYNVQLVQDTLDNLNEKLEHSNELLSEVQVPQYCSYSVTEPFIKKYRSIFQMLRQLALTMQEMRQQIPESMKVFRNIGLLE